MGIYFKPLRRKLGVVTLLIALMAMVGWVRSASLTEGVVLPADKHTLNYLFSCRQTITFMCEEHLGMKFSWKHCDWFSHPTPHHNDDSTNWLWKWGGFGIADGVNHRLDNPPGFQPATILAIPFWSIGALLTLLSACLLLWRARKPTSDKREASLQGSSGIVSGD